MPNKHYWLTTSLIYPKRFKHCASRGWYFKPRAKASPSALLSAPVLGSEQCLSCSPTAGAVLCSHTLAAKRSTFFPTLHHLVGLQWFVRTDLFVQCSASLTQIMTAPERPLTRENKIVMAFKSSTHQGMSDTHAGPSLHTEIGWGEMSSLQFARRLVRWEEVLHAIAVIASLHLPGNPVPGRLVCKGELTVCSHFGYRSPAEPVGGL